MIFPPTRKTWPELKRDQVNAQIQFLEAGARRYKSTAAMARALKMDRAYLMRQLGDWGITTPAQRNRAGQA